MEPNKIAGVKKKKQKYDQPIIGFGLGLVVYLVAMLLVYYMRHRYSFSMSHLKSIFTSTDNIFFMNESSRILSLSMIGLLAPFYFLINRNKLVAARGVIVVALLSAVLILLYNFVWQ